MPNSGLWTLSVDSPPIADSGTRLGMFSLRRGQMGAQGVQGRAPRPHDKRFDHHDFGVSALGMT